MERSGQSASTGWYCIDELQLHVLTTISERDASPWRYSANRIGVSPLLLLLVRCIPTARSVTGCARCRCGTCQRLLESVW